jgi:hypothetical protein
MRRYACGIRSLAILFAAAGLLGCTGVPPVPIDAPNPISRQFLEYLEQPLVSETEVVRWLGAPAITRPDGSSAIYALFREHARSWIRQSPIGTWHFLIVEYDNGRFVTRAEEREGDGCFKTGLCIYGASTVHSGRYAQYAQLEPKLRKDPAAIRAHAAANTFVYRSAQRESARLETPPEILEPPADGACRIIIFHQTPTKRGWERDSVLWIAPAPAADVYEVPFDSYLTWTAAPGQLHAQVTWRDATGLHTEVLEATCSAGTILLRGIEMTARGSSQALLHRIQIHDRSPEEAREVLRNRRQVIPQ